MPIWTSADGTSKTEVDYTEIPGGSHGIIGQVYQDKKLHEWMFEQTKGKKAEK